VAIHGAGHRAANERQLAAGPLHVLVVEDVLLAAEALCELLEYYNCKAVGPAGRCKRALALLDEDPPDAALLDISLGPETSFPVADALQARGIPFAFLTGYSDESFFPPRFDGVPVLGKPLDMKALHRVLVDYFAGAVHERHG
jgi:CheY-like chemotaxis protein